jgi:hypothetical protein
MTKQLHMCTDRVLPLEQENEAKQIAIEENPANIPPPNEPQEARPLSGAADTRKLWKPGRVLRVRFLDGVQAVQEKVKAIAQGWTNFANITFVFSDDPDAEIRISFQLPGSWSYIGTDALLIPKDQPTMNLGWLTPNTDDEEYSRVVLHEFGHALGMIHEHQNPAGKIPWNEQAVLDYYMGPPNYWTEAQVRSNIFQTYNKAHTKFTEFDMDSIMRYPIPRAHVTDPKWAVEWQNYQLSDLDKEFIGECYPRE